MKRHVNWSSCLWAVNYIYKLKTQAKFSSLSSLTTDSFLKCYCARQEQMLVSVFTGDMVQCVHATSTRPVVHFVQIWSLVNIKHNLTYHLAINLIFPFLKVENCSQLHISGGQIRPDVSKGNSVVTGDWSSCCNTPL